MSNNVKILLSHQMIGEIAKFLTPTCNIPYALVKGEALSIQAYNKPGLGQLGDIDILISRRNVKGLEHLLNYGIPQPHLRKGIFRHRAIPSARTGIFP